jgi:hypothetical protein
LWISKRTHYCTIGVAWKELFQVFWPGFRLKGSDLKEIRALAP